MDEKYHELKRSLKELSPVAVAFSGGVDSSFLLKVSVDVLGPGNVIALTAHSLLSFPDELQRARKFARNMGVEHVVLDIPDLIDEPIRGNPKDRCYHCKKKIFASFIAALESEFDGKPTLIEGTNLDDINSYRPGRKAIEELGIHSPLLESGVDKEIIRSLSWKLNLPTWDHPSQSCLATRFPYGEELTKKKLGMVEDGEAYLKALGFRGCRLRYHGGIARIEVLQLEWERFLHHSSEIVHKLRSLGFTYVTMDMEGLRSGSMDI
ncbi:MAG: ATP-dependent sacrificial sulfur transferase LarE [Thermoplasmata archaeon]